ncbi:TPM domain-containing protein [Lacinutrix algicola]|uniref:TPM domain-containing protein n=1 Tax=Lacinutrix algicola TaxID=342954 RepID=UPI00128F28C0|nr:TPM domain-containing protein [Lacinutrix algicola]
MISYHDRDMAIATGYGVEKVITDSIAKTIIKQTIVPRFKDNLYFEGATIGLDSIISK